MLLGIFWEDYFIFYRSFVRSCNSFVVMGVDYGYGEGVRLVRRYCIDVRGIFGFIFVYYVNFMLWIIFFFKLIYLKILVNLL